MFVYSSLIFILGWQAIDDWSISRWTSSTTKVSLIISQVSTARIFNFIPKNCDNCRIFGPVQFFESMSKFSRQKWVSVYIANLKQYTLSVISWSTFIGQALYGVDDSQHPPLHYKKFSLQDQTKINECYVLGTSAPCQFDHLVTASIAGGFNARYK